MNKDNQCYTIITFAPIQAFIEKSRKLRDLYGSSYILSFLSWIICLAAEKQGYKVVSPALPNVVQGMPNQIVIAGNLSEADINKIQEAFNQAWKCLVDSCREWIEQNVKEGKDKQKNIIQWDYRFWQRDWQLWANHSWEFFAAPGKDRESITDARQRLNQVKNQRNWTGINWQGESSTLSGTDAIAYPDLGRKVDPRDYDYQQERTKVRAFYEQLSQKLGESFLDATPKPKIEKKKEAKEQEKIEETDKTELSKKYGSSFIDSREELSITELIKRLITHKVVIDDLVKRLRKLKLVKVENEDTKLASYLRLTEIAHELNPYSFRDLSRQKDDNSKEEEKYWTGWFLGDGDSASKYFKQFAEDDAQQEEEKLTEFSKEMREWGRELRFKQKKYLQGKGRMIYAGGDDFLGVLYYPDQKISPYNCLQWFYTFKSEIWHKPKPKKITPSVGFVWAGNQVPQRDVLQHCHLAEKSAKSTGRDRIAFRILFNSGNYLEWVCPWWLLDKEDRPEADWWLLDNKKRQESAKNNMPTLSESDKNLLESYHDRDGGKNWTHFYQDVAILESRHAFSEQSLDIALGLVEIYFDSKWKEIIANCDNWWNHYSEHELQTFTGILGDPKRFNPEYKEPPESREDLNNNPKVKEAFNNWVINLAKVGFHLTDDYGRTNQRLVSVSHTR
ncbi:MAG: CRISPR-associated protein [Symploca sp. SIO2E9]|nr:CRISPR-associated protein [Symploca sp. SIO2E9]